ncbi:MAG TPA: hypothetical protein VGL53_26375 [Bryobacteraceae bacterium]|jgi:hypothetical protein
MKPRDIGIAGIVLVCLFAIAYFVKSWQFPCTLAGNGADCVSDNVYWSVFWGFAWILASFWFGYLCAIGTPAVGADTKQGLLFASFMLSGVVGGTAGWLLGVYFFPVDSGEAAAFNKIGTMVGSFITGYLLKNFSEILQYLTNTNNGQKAPLILSPAYRECAGFFIVSLLVSGGVQVAVRNLSDVRISWDGVTPASKIVEGVPRYVIQPGDKRQLAGAATGSSNIAVRWRLEARDSAPLKFAVDHQLLVITPDGELSAAEEKLWSDAHAKLDFDFDIVASAAARPQSAQSLAARIEDKVAAAPPAPPGSSGSTGAK